LWKVHVHSEIIPANRHRTNDIYEIDSNQERENHEQELCREEREIDLFKEVSLEFMIGELYLMCPKTDETLYYFFVGYDTCNDEKSSYAPEIILTE
jgi:hypothetical protein